MGPIVRGLNIVGLVSFLGKAELSTTKLATFGENIVTNSINLLSIYLGVIGRSCLD